MAIKWNDNMATGIDVVDVQHQGLFSRLNSLLDAISQGKGREEIRAVLEFLTDYTTTHFRNEEDVMDYHHYPALSAHKEMHKKFVKDVFDLRMEYETTGNTSLLLLRVPRHLGNWLIKHIGSEDKKFSDFLKSGVGTQASPAHERHG